MEFLAATKQPDECFSPSVHGPSIHLSHFFFTMFLLSYHHEMLLRLTPVMSMQKVKIRGQGHRSKNNFAPIWAFLGRNSSLNSE